MFKIGHKRKLEPDDMYSVLPEDRSQHLGVSTDIREKGERVRISTWGCVWGRLCLPLGSSETPLLTLHTQPLRLTPGLAHFGGPCSLCICGRGGSPQPWPWRPSSVSEVGSLEKGVYPPELLMTCESRKAWQELFSKI